MVKPFKQIFSELKNKSFDPVYFLHGEESFFIDQVSGFIENNILSESEKSFNQAVFYGNQADMASVLTQARRFPMMSERQVVIIKEAQEMPDLGRQEGQNLLLSYLENPTPSTVLVFCHKHKTLDKRKALGKGIGKLATVLEAKRIYENQVPAWIQSYMDSRGKKINTKAAIMLAEFTGNQLDRLSNELEKVLLNIEDGEITPDHIQKFVGVSKDYNSFELQKALVVRNIEKTYRIVKYFKSNPKRNPVIPIIALLFNFYSKLLTASQSNITNEKQLASTLKINPYFARDYVSALEQYSQIQLVNCLKAIQQADQQSKGINGSINEGEILVQLVFTLLHPSQQ